MTTTAISISQAQEGTTSGQPIVANLQQVRPIAPAQLKCTDDKTKQVWSLCHTYKGFSGKIDLEHESYKKIKAESLDKIWDRVIAHLGPGAQEVEINLTKLTVRYQDAAGKVHYLDISTPDPNKPFDPDLLNLIQNVRQTAREVCTNMGFHDPASTGNRTTDGAAPLQIPTDHWANHMPKSLGQFVSHGHFEQLCNVSGNAATALKKMAAAETFVKGMKTSVEELRKRKEEEMKSQDFHRKPKEEKDVLSKSLEGLRQLEKELDEIDRFALYWAVGVWGDTDPNTSSKERLEKAELVSSGVRSSLSGFLKPGEDPRWKPTQFLGINKSKGETLLGLTPYVSAYAGDAGDLVLHNKLEYIQRVDLDGTRTSRAPSVIEFVVHNIMNLNAPGFDAGAALDSLGTGFDQNTRTALSVQINTQRTSALRVEGQAAKLPATGTSKELLKAMANNNQFKELAGKT